MAQIKISKSYRGKYKNARFNDQVAIYTKSTVEISFYIETGEGLEILINRDEAKSIVEKLNKILI